VSISLSLRVFLEQACLTIFLHIIVILLFFAKSAVESFELWLRHAIRECHVELDVEVSELIRSLVEGKTLVSNSLQVVRLDYFTRVVLDSDLCAVEVSQCEVDSSERVDECDVLFDQEISALSLELFVRLLLANDDNITGLSAWVFVSFTVERILVLVWCAFVNIDLDDLLLLEHFLTITSLTFVLLIDDFTLASAVIAWAL